MKIRLPVVGPDLPIHQYTGLTALGLRRNGAPIWPVKGGAPDDDEQNDDDTGDDEGGKATDDQGGDEAREDLRDAGKKALDVMKAAKNKARADLRPWTALARDLGVNGPDEVRNLLRGKKADGGDVPDPEQIRREARAEADREVAKERLLDKIEAKAGRFADPADAAALLLRENVADDFLDGTRVDAAAIAEALDDLLERKPYLAAKVTRERTSGPKPDKSQGARSGKPSGREAALAEARKRFGVKSAVT